MTPAIWFYLIRRGADMSFEQFVFCNDWYVLIPVTSALSDFSLGHLLLVNPPTVVTVFLTDRFSRLKLYRL